MKITVLTEDTTISEKLECEHGLSFYIETANHRILFDVGASPLFAINAEKLGIDLKSVDTVIISHGHYDHGRGLQTFLNINTFATIYIRKNAFNDYYSLRPDGELVYIGLDKSLIDNPRFVFTEEYLAIDGELELFSGVSGKEFFSTSNSVLMMKESGNIVCDTFIHEQNLIISEKEESVLICGCSHNGIVNIVNAYVDMKWQVPKYVLGGFHLSNPRTKKTEDAEFIKKLGYKLNQYDSVYFTCHCTGIEPYLQLKEILKDKIHYVATGNSIDINTI